MSADAELSKRPLFAWIRRNSVGVLLALAIVAFAPGLLNSYTLWDDVSYIRDNPLLRTPEGLYKIWFSFDAPQYYPLTFTSYWIEYQLWGDWPGAVFAVNAALHGLAAILLLRVLRALPVSPGIALFVAALFVVHPLQVASVAWLAERKNVLCGVFTMLTLLAYVRHVRQRRPYWLCLTVFVAALLAKTAIVTLPLSIWLLDVLVLRSSWRAALARVVPLCTVAAIFGYLTVAREHHGNPELVGQALNPLGAATAIWTYVSNTLLPVALPAMYPQWHIDVADPRWWIPILSLLALTGVAIGYATKIDPLILWGSAHFVLLCLPSSGLAPFGFVSISPVGDHLVYFALPGLFLALARGGDLLLRRKSGEKSGWAYGAGALIVMACVPLTWSQVRMWRDGESLWRSTILLAPENLTAHLNLGAALMEEGRLPEALESFETAYRIDHSDARACLNRATLLYDLGRYDEAEKAALELAARRPHPLSIDRLLGWIYARQQHWDEARRCMARSVQADADSAAAWTALGDASLQVKQPNAAVEQLETAVGKDETDPSAWRLLALAYEASGDANKRNDALARGRTALLRHGNVQAARQLDLDAALP